MNTQYFDNPAQVVTRDRRDRVLGIVAAVTLLLSWCLSAGLDAQRGGERIPRRQSVSTAQFNAAFAAANRVSELKLQRRSCERTECGPMLAEAESTKPPAL